MNKDNKRLLIYLGMIFGIVILNYKLPHDTYSIIQYIFSLIRNNRVSFNLSGIIIIIWALFFIGLRGLFDLERFKERSRLLIFVVVIIIIMPIMKGILDFSRTSYHWIKGDGVQAVDIVDGMISLNGSNGEVKIAIKLQLKDYGTKTNEFKVSVYLPKTLSKYTKKDLYQFEHVYVTHGEKNTILNVEEQISVKLDNEEAKQNLFNEQWHYEDVTYELYNDKESVKLIDRGL
jgi:hypothetical protein